NRKRHSFRGRHLRVWRYDAHPHKLKLWLAGDDNSWVIDEPRIVIISRRRWEYTVVLCLETETESEIRCEVIGDGLDRCWLARHLQRRRRWRHREMELLEFEVMATVDTEDRRP